MDIIKENKFKALSVDKEWIIAPFYFKDGDRHYLKDENGTHEVIPPILQNIGQKDLLGNEVFELDVAICFSGWGPEVGVFGWDKKEKKFGFFLYNEILKELRSVKLNVSPSNYENYYFVDEMNVIGNILKMDFNKEFIKSLYNHEYNIKKIDDTWETLEDNFKKIKNIIMGNGG